MFKLFTFVFHTIPMILVWLYLLVAVFCVVVHIKQIKNKTKISIGQWAYSILNAGYILFFLVTRIFFPDFWEQTFGVLGLVCFFWLPYMCRLVHLVLRLHLIRWWLLLLRWLFLSHFFTDLNSLARYFQVKQPIGCVNWV